MMKHNIDFVIGKEYYIDENEHRKNKSGTVAGQNGIWASRLAKMQQRRNAITS